MGSVLWPQQENAASAGQIVAMLHDTASLVALDPGAARTRLDRIASLLEKLQAPASAGSAAPGLLAAWQAKRVATFVEQHLDQPIRIQALAAQVGLSASYFFRAFRGSFGLTPHAFVMRCRTERAMRLLADSDDPIAQIAIACGFADQAHFSRVFARQVGAPPGVWRRLQRVSRPLAAA